MVLGRQSPFSMYVEGVFLWKNLGELVNFLYFDLAAKTKIELSCTFLSFTSFKGWHAASFPDLCSHGQSSEGPEEHFP